MTKRTITDLAKRQADLVAELADVRAEIAARAGETVHDETAALRSPSRRKRRKATT
jgi:hypothetical protein